MSPRNTIPRYAFIVGLLASALFAMQWNSQKSVDWAQRNYSDPQEPRFKFVHQHNQREHMEPDFQTGHFEPVDEDCWAFPWYDMQSPDGGGLWE